MTQPLIEADIDHVGAAGDGVVLRAGANPLHVGRVLPGESVILERQAGAAGTRARLVAVRGASPDRVEPPCPHFGQGCGGCALQHWAGPAYAAWKRGLVVAALQRAGFGTQIVGPLVCTPGRTRRRMDFAVRREQGAGRFGLHRAHSAEIVDLDVCEVLLPALAALIAPLRDLLSSLGALRREGSLLATALDGGADLLIRTDGPLPPTDRAKLAAFAAAHGLARISWAQGAGLPETAAMLSQPMARFAGRDVGVPPAAFLQASAEGEAAIVRAMLEGLPSTSTSRAYAIELFAGVGTLSFPLAERLRVLAFEGDAAAVAAVRRAQSGSRVEMTHRDLVRQPLSAKELRGASVIVLDPPYAGAAVQSALIGESGVPRVIYVSCNPAALARDGALLAEAGYTVLQATPIDQFVWSAQVECVAVFERSGRRR